MSGYNHQTIEPKWQARWQQHNAFHTPSPGDADFDPRKPKFYVLDMFPYPSGVGLHVGHPLGYIATDIVARYKRMRGFNVLHPMGFDAFGLPAEQFAVEHGVHPRVTTEKNIENMVRQLKLLGLSYDWDRRIATTDTHYYKWTQWVFLQLYHSYFDPATQKARPIDELVNHLESGQLNVGPDGRLIPVPASGAMDALGGPAIGARKWHELDAADRDAVLAQHRLAYLAEVPVNWCPALGTVLANEEVTNEGRSERGNHPVFKRPLEQWMLRITAYADRLGDDLDLVDWPEPIKLMQRNWIGRSEGALVDFAVEEAEDEIIRVFTTRPDTLFGATYMVLAPEHPLVDPLTTADHRDAVKEYQRLAASRSDMDRQAETKQKTGVFTGVYAVNPVNGERIPIWIADYVMMGYGTGAIMAVPAHDDRDFDFARQFDLPIRPVVQPDTPTPAPDTSPAPDTAFTAPGTAIHSANDDLSLNGLPTPEAKAKITHWLESKNLGRAKVQYKLRDWLFSRQRYWGEPFPILHGPDGEVRPVAAADLPVTLPEMEDFSPEATDDPAAPPRPPLSRAPESSRIVEIDGVKYERELNTMPQWAGSCWYYLRFIDPANSDRFVDPQKEHYWMTPAAAATTPAPDGDRASESDPAASLLTQAPMGVDLYVGGAEHAVLHLLYARFWHKVLFDLGHVSTPEPFGRLFNQGYIQAYAYQDERGIHVDATRIQEEETEKGVRHLFEGQPVTRSLGKMGKSLKNAVSPDEMCEQYGADTLRLYEMYLGPLDQSKPWNTRDIVGVNRFLNRIWRNFIEDESDQPLITDDPPTGDQLRLLHKTIHRVTDSMERMAFNTAIAALIEMNNALVPIGRLPRALAEPFLRMLAPLAPHIAEELWERLGHDSSLTHEPWPVYDPKHLVEDRVQIAVQVMGKVRGRITVPADADQKTIENAALTDEKIAASIHGKTVRKVIVVPGKLVNIVAN